MAPRIVPALALSVLWGTTASAQALRTHVGSFENGFFGEFMAFVGDCDGDGVEDYAVGEPVTFQPAGVLSSVRLFSGATGQVLWVRPGVQGRELGRGVARIGDVNMDGVPDVLAGQRYGLQNVLVLSGVDGAVLRSNSGPAGFQHSFPLAVTGAGDVNGDGVPDFAAIGRANADNLLVYSGADGSLVWSSAIEGRSLASIADLNADGVRELLVGDTWHSQPVNRDGRALVIDGSSGSVLRTHLSDAGVDGADYGAAICALEDVNGDGVEDYAISATGENSGAAFTSWVDVRSGGDGSLIRRMTHFFGSGIGAGLTSAGDIDGDGLGDLLVGSNSRWSGYPGTGLVRCYSIATGRLLALVPGVAGEGIALGMGPDLDGDGRPELWIGNSQFAVDQVGFRVGRVRATPLLPRANPTARVCFTSPNATGAPGRIGVQGSTSIASNDLTLTAIQLPPNTFGLFYFGEYGATTGLGNGLNCVGSIERLLPILSTGGGSVSRSVNVTELDAFLEPELRVGETRYFQFWFRDPLPTGAGSNVTDAIAIQFRK